MSKKLVQLKDKNNNLLDPINYNYEMQLKNHSDRLESLESKKDIYSTNEVKTNKVWIGDKPIYRKTYLLSNVTSALSNIDVTSLNIDKIINLYGMSYNNSLQIPVNFYNTGNFNQCYYSSNIKAIQYQFNFGSDAYIIIEYTKTTD